MTAAWIRCIGSVAVLALGVVPLGAGGWVVITVADLPDYVTVGRSLTLRYAVRQHGVDLRSNLPGRLEARLGKSMVGAAAEPAGEPGFYVAALTLPHAGEWAVDIDSGFGGPFSSSRISLTALDPWMPANPTTDLERGKRLFAAKGCVTCHARSGIEGQSIPAGPALIEKRRTAGVHEASAGGSFANMAGPALWANA